jgi:hypothetical protein
MGLRNLHKICEGIWVSDLYIICEGVEARRPTPHFLATGWWPMPQKCLCCSDLLNFVLDAGGGDKLSWRRANILIFAPGGPPGCSIVCDQPGV